MRRRTFSHGHIIGENELGEFTDPYSVYVSACEKLKDTVDDGKPYAADYIACDGRRVRIWVGNEQRYGTHHRTERSTPFVRFVTKVYAGERKVRRLDSIPEHLEKIWELLVGEVAKRFTHERTDANNVEVELRGLSEHLEETDLLQEEEADDWYW
jgi:hypothetical protein